jgi:hypothetical protein
MFTPYSSLYLAIHSRIQKIMFLFRTNQIPLEEVWTHPGIVLGIVLRLSLQLLNSAALRLFKNLPWKIRPEIKEKKVFSS